MVDCVFVPTFLKCCYNCFIMNINNVLFTFAFILPSDMYETENMLKSIFKMSGLIFSQA